MEITAYDATFKKRFLFAIEKGAQKNCHYCSMFIKTSMVVALLSAVQMDFFSAGAIQTPELLLLL